MEPTIRDRLHGCVVGAAIGDALGMPLEFGPRRSADALVREMLDGRISAGSFTDDTEMALALADSLIAHSPLDPVDLGQRFAAWYRSGPSDVGNHTGDVLGRISAGEPWEKSVVGQFYLGARQCLRSYLWWVCRDLLFLALDFFCQCAAEHTFPAGDWFLPCRNP